jgi:hypothetical protein
LGIVALLWLCVGLSSAAQDFSIPEGYVLQRLEATDGSIAMPTGWHYRSRGTPSGWLYTLSKEKPEPYYETGVRIQLLLGVEKGTKQARDAFVNAQIAKKKAGSEIEVIQECAQPSDAGFFWRKCLEVIEPIQLGAEPPKRFHILYTFSWSKTGDMVVVQTFGSPIEQWEEHKLIPAAMNGAVLIGPNLGKNADRDAQPKP